MGKQIEICSFDNVPRNRWVAKTTEQSMLEIGSSESGISNVPAFVSIIKLYRLNKQEENRRRKRPP